MIGYVRVGDMELSVSSLRLVSGRILIKASYSGYSQTRRAKPILLGEDGRVLYQSGQVVEVDDMSVRHGRFDLTWEIKFDPVVGRVMAEEERIYS